MCAYGWTIDYINDSVTIPQIVYLLEVMKQNPPASILSFGLGEKKTEKKLLSQIDSLGDKVKVDKWLNKPNIKSVIRLKDKKVIK
jgi:hypothetical protein